MPEITPTQIPAQRRHYESRSNKKPGKYVHPIIVKGVGIGAHF
jgi:hypothetical protein